MPALPELRVVLVSPFIDLGVVRLVETIQSPYPITIRLCIPDGDKGVKLVSPTEPGIPKDHCWDQSEVSRGQCQVGWDQDKGLLIRGQPLVSS